LLGSDRIQRNFVSVHLRNIQEEVPVLASVVSQRKLRLHDQGFFALIRFLLGRAYFNTNTASSTIFRGNLYGIFQSLLP
jgi:hypothetical protein